MQRQVDGAGSEAEIRPAEIKVKGKGLVALLLDDQNLVLPWRQSHVVSDDRAGVCVDCDAGQVGQGYGGCRRHERVCRAAWCVVEQARALTMMGGLGQNQHTTIGQDL